MKPDPVMSKHPDLQVERCLLRQGYGLIAGIDEVGRGAWAGPVVAAAVCLPLRRRNLARQLRGVRDSKQMTPQSRQAWQLVIRRLAVAVAVGQARVEEVDAMGVAAATRLAMQRAVEGLSLPPDHLLIDYVRLPDIGLPQISLPQGDQRSLTIAAASVVAKVQRDEQMITMEAEFPGYGFAAHKGYGTQQHMQALDQLGPSQAHRLSFAPVAARCSPVAALP